MRPVRIAAVVMVALAAGFFGLRQGRERSERPSANPKSRVADPSTVRQQLLDPSQPWFRTTKDPIPVVEPSVLPPIAARVDQIDPPVGATLLNAGMIDYLFVSQQVRLQPLPPDHPFFGRHFEIIDLRSSAEFAQSHIPYSLNVAYETMADSLANGILAHLEREVVLVLVGRRHPSADVVLALRAAGFGTVYVLQGGYEEWEAQEYRREGSKAPAAAATSAASDPATPPILPMQQRAPVVTAADLREMLKGSIPPLVVFVSPIPELYKKGRIPGALYVPVNQVGQYFLSYPRDRKIVFYCGCCKGASEGLSGTAVHILEGLGFTDVRHLQGHLEAWQLAGFPVESDPP